MPATLRSACARLRAAVDRSLVSAVRGLHAWRPVAVPASWGPRVEPLEGRILFSEPATAPWSGSGPAFDQRAYCQCKPLLLQESSASQNKEGPQMGQDSSLAPIRYSDGQAEVSATDISSSAIGGAFDQARSFSMSVTSGPLGNHWTAFDMPFLVDTPSDPNRPAGASDTITVVESGVDQVWFDDFSGTWVQRDSGQDTLIPNGTTHLFTLADTTGQTLQFDDFSPTSTSNDVAGQFCGMADAAGNVTAVTGTSMTYDGDITQIRRSSAVGSEVESWDFSYVTVGGTPVISTVDLSRSTDGGSTFTSVQEADYAYYTDNSEAGGSTGDLASVQVYDSSNLSDPVSVTDYRYWKSGESVDGMTQPLGDLKAILNTADMARASAAGFDPATSSDADLAPYANNFYAYYDSSHTPVGFPDPPVYQETAAGFGGTSTSGLGTFTYTYTDSGLTAGYNTWSQKTVEDLPGGGSNTIYTNYEGGVILNAHVASGDEWDTGYEYNASGAQIIAAQPSAVTTTYVSGEPTLLTDGSTWYLNSTGLENVTSYASTTTATSTSAGDVAGYVSGTALRQGYATGSDIPQSGQMYIAHTDANGNTVYQTASSTVYRNTDGTGAETTAYSFQWFSGTNAIEAETTTLPTITTGENGSNSAVSTTEDFDRLGNALYTIDGDGFAQADQYDPGTGAITQDVQDAPPYAATVLADGPLAYYRLDEASGTVAADSSGNGNTAAYSGGVTLGAAGALDNDADTSASLNGSTGQATVPDSAQFSLTGAISMEAWFKTTDAGTNYILSKGTSAGSLALNPAGLSAGQVGVYLTGVNDSSGHGWLYSPSSGYNDGQWHQAAATYDGTTLRLYIDGSQVATLAYSGTLATNADDISIGSNAGSSDFFNGSLDEVSVYASALGAGRVLAHYEAATIARTPLALTTTSQIDVLGRTIEQTSPAGNKTYTLFTDGYNSSTGVIGEAQTYTGWNATTGTTTGPIDVSLEYLPSSSGEVVYSEALTSSATPAVSGSPGSYVPTGAETLDASNIQSLSRVLTNDGNQTTEEDDYSSLSGASYSLSSYQLGTAGTNFNATVFGYSSFMGGQNHVVDATGTITDTVMDGRGRPVATYTGTDDTGATDSDPTNGGAGGNNMTETQSAEYDNNGIGDGNLTDVTVYPGGGAANRSTLDFYNWRDELMAEKDGASSTESDPAGRPIYYYTLDNLGEVTEIQQFDGDNVTVTTTDGVPVVPSSSLRVAESTASYDELGDVYQTTVFPVTAGTGSVGTYGLNTETYRDARGDVIETINPGGEVDKSAFDGAGRDIMDSVTDGGAAGNGGTPLLGYADAGSTVGDVVFSLTQHVHDLDGDEIETVSSDMAPSPASTSTVPDASFEYPNASGGYIYDPSTDSSNPWTFTGGSGVTANGNAFTYGNPDTTDGSQVAFLQAGGSDISQSITFAAGTYTLTFSAAQRGNFNHGGQDFQVLVDGNVVDTVTPASIDYQDVTTAAFTVTAGSHTIEFHGLDTVGGDNTAFIDDVRLNAVPFRTSYVANYFDDAGRETANENVGTDGGTAWTRPSSPDASDATHLVTTYGYAADNVQTVTLAGASGGTFTLSFNGYTTGSIAYDASAATVQSDLAGLTGVGSANVAVTTVTEGSAVGPYVIRFLGTLAGTSQPAITAASSLTGSGPSISAVVTVPGGDAGLVQTSIDPRGVAALSDFDMLGETLTTIAGFTTGVPSADTNQTTDFTYNGGEETSQTALMPAGTNSQTTDWVFGVTTGGGSTIDSNNLLAKEEFPDPTTGAASTSPGNDVGYTVDSLGEGLTMTDQNGSTHTYAMDTLGRETGNTVTTLGSGVDGSALMLGYTYTALGGVYQATTYADTGGATVLTQDQFVYNGLGQETQEYQSGSGAVVTSGPTPTPSVQFGYAGPAAGENYSRFVSETYPDGRQIDTQYNTALDSAISRPDAVADDSAPTLPLASYSYLGLSTIVQQTDGNDVGLSYLQQAGDASAITSGSQYAGDAVTGLDRFGQVIDQNWVLNPTPASTPTPTPTPVSTDRTQLGHDRDGNVLYSDNLVNPAESELYHASSIAGGDDNTAYDPLGRESAFLRGTLSASGNNASTGSGLDTVANAAINTAANSDETFSLDAVGNWSSSAAGAGTGTGTAPTLTSTSRTNNSQNELTGDGAATLAFNNNGDTTTDQNGDLFTYTAWGQIATNLNPATNHQLDYTTDALGNRVAELDTAGTAAGPTAIVNNGSAQRSMVDSLTVVFPSAVTLSAGAITVYNTTDSSYETAAYSNPSGDGKTWRVTFSGGDITGGSLPDGVFNLVVHHADVSGITLGSDITWTFHRLFGDINGDASVDGTDEAAMSLAIGSTTGSAYYDPALDANANGHINGYDVSQFGLRYGTSLTYTPAGSYMAGASTTAPASSTDISSWADSANDMYYSGSNVIEERFTGSGGAWRQEVWGLGYVNSLIEQDTATAVDSGGVLPTSHFLRYALDTSFNGSGTLVGAAGSYDSVAIQPSNGDVVVAGVSGSDLVVTRLNPGGAVDTNFNSIGTVSIGETYPTFAELAVDSDGNIDVAVNNGSSVEVYQLSGVDGSTLWSTTLTFATAVVPRGIALEPSGDIIVAGDSSGGAGIYLAGVDPATGAVDTGFGTSGYVNAPLSGAPSGLSVALDATGNILVAGSDSGDFSVVRLTSSGALDPTFGTSGEVTVNMGGTDTAYAVAPGPAGTIVAAGVSVQSGNNYDALIRLTSSGALDTSFGTSGKVVGSSGSGTIRAILVQTNGAVLAGGDAGSGTAQKVWMCTPAGAADTEFASGGSLTANSGATVYGWAVASGPTQRIIVAGSYGGDEALAAFAPDSVRLYAQQNANCNVTAMVDSNGNVVQRMAYDLYGNMTVLSATWTPQSDLFNTQVGFQGMWLDAGSGLYHTPNRDYDPATGRWREADPSGYRDLMNRYQAFDGAPASRVDPDGLSPHSPTPAEQVRVINGTKVPIVVQGDDPGSPGGEYWDVLGPTESSAKGVDTDYVWYKGSWWKLSPNARDVIATKTHRGSQEPSLYAFTGDPCLLGDLRRVVPVNKDLKDRDGKPMWYPGSPNSAIRIPQPVVDRYKEAGGDDWPQLQDSVKQRPDPAPPPPAKSPYPPPAAPTTVNQGGFNFPPDLSPGARRALQAALAAAQSAPATRPSSPAPPPATRPSQR